MRKAIVLLSLCSALCCWAQDNGAFRPMEDVNRVVDLTLDSLNKAQTARPIPGSSRKGNNPVLFLVGNSTMRTGTLGNGDNGQWGWGYYFHNYIDESRITVENHALGGTSSRTFYNRLWAPICSALREGDYVFIELGHNDNGPFDSGRARATIRGIGKDSLNVVIKETGRAETVYSYGEYLRRFVKECKAKGAKPILLSLTPRNAWTENGRIGRVNETFGLWAKQIAEEESIPFIDLNDITARKYEQFGAWKTNSMFYLDRIHTSAFGAEVNAESAAEGCLDCGDALLAGYIKQPVKAQVSGLRRVNGKPVVFSTGDSTVKNEDRNPNGMWGWGSQAALAFDTTRYTTYNAAMAGRSLRTFISEGRWQRVYNSIQPGDYVLIQFGHNDIGDIDKGKARADINGIADTSRVYRIESTGKYEVVYSFGWYLRKMIGDVREKGGTPVLITLTPRNIWKNGKIERRCGSNTAWAWTKAIAEETATPLIDLHNLAADYLDSIGETAAKAYYNNDHTHTSLTGAQLNATLISKQWHNIAK